MAMVTWRGGSRVAGQVLTGLLVWALVAPPGAVAAPVEQGATMTVLRGEVAVIGADGTVRQPAASGILVYAGDEVRTLNPSGALVTFFSGTEIEMQDHSSIRIERAERDGSRVEVSIKQVFGTTINRVETFAHPGSVYRVEAGGAVALVRG